MPSFCRERHRQHDHEPIPNIHLVRMLGNIGRSPLAEGVVRRRFADAGIPMVVASCCTGRWHVGEAKACGHLDVG